MVHGAAAAPGCAWSVDAGACTPKGDRGSSTSPFRRVRPCAAGRVQTGAGVANATPLVTDQAAARRARARGSDELHRLGRPAAPPLVGGRLVAGGREPPRPPPPGEGG